MFDYEQRKNTDEYRNNFDSIFRNRNKTRRKDRSDKKEAEDKETKEK